MAKSTEREDRVRSLVTRIDGMPENDVRKVPLASGAHAWVRRRVVEGRYVGVEGDVRHPVNTFDVWLRDEPGDPPREAVHEPNTHSVAQRLLGYESGVAADIFL
jgi:hypothetical protein